MTEQHHRDPGQPLRRLMDIVDALRTECGWTARLTPESLAPYLVEEAAEVSEAVRQARLGQDLADELGDVLFQLMLHSRLGEERGDLDLVAIIEALTQKLLRRNTHVFAPDGSVLENPRHAPEEAERAWREAKARERARAPHAPSGMDPLRGLPPTLPALLLAQKALSRADLVPDAAAPASAEGPQSEDAESIGDELLALAARAKAAGIDAETALRDALERAIVAGSGSQARQR